MPPRIHAAWTRTLLQLIAVLAVAAIVGALVDHIWMALAVAALGVVAWHYWKLYDLLARLTSRSRVPPPQGDGVWQETDRMLHRGQQDMRARKRRLIGMLRAYRAVAAALPDAVVVVDRNSQRVQWFNEAATALLGLHHPGDLGEALVERLQPMPLAHWLAGGRNAEPILDVPCRSIRRSA